MFAEQKPDTEEVLYYEVPVLGIEPQYEICLIHSLRPAPSIISKPVKSKGEIYI